MGPSIASGKQFLSPRHPSLFLFWCSIWGIRALRFTTPRLLFDMSMTLNFPMFEVPWILETVIQGPFTSFLTAAMCSGLTAALGLSPDSSSRFAWPHLNSAHKLWTVDLDGQSIPKARYSLLRNYCWSRLHWKSWNIIALMSGGLHLCWNRSFTVLPLR